MKKILILVCTIFFLVYTIIGLFYEIPKKINNTVYVLCSLGAVYFVLFVNSSEKEIKNTVKGLIKEKREQKEANKK